MNSLCVVYLNTDHDHLNKKKKNQPSQTINFKKKKEEFSVLKGQSSINI